MAPIQTALTILKHKIRLYGTNTNRFNNPASVDNCHWDVVVIC